MRWLRFTMLYLAALTFAATSGCGGGGADSATSGSTPAGQSSQEGSDSHADHDHEEGEDHEGHDHEGHDHGDHEGHDHEGEAENGEHQHSSVGPHGGDLIELGNEEYHAELVHDDASEQVTVYILDGRAKATVPIEQTALMLNLIVDGKPAQFKLQADPVSGDPAGRASRFSANDPQLCESLCAEGVKGRLNVQIDYRSYVGSIEHTAHSHDHEHGHKH